jgi:hypothetical protein
VGSKRLDILHEPEGARARNRAEIGLLGEINLDLLHGGINGWMPEVDRKAELETEVRIQTRPFVAITDFDRPLDADESLGG